MDKRHSIFINQDIRKIFTLAWPVMIGSILQTLLSTVDTYFISNLGTSEAAAASLGNSASSVVFVMSALVSAGTIALVSRSYGNNRMEDVIRFSGQSITLSAIAGGILGILCFMYTDEIITLAFNAGPEESALAGEYLSVIFLGTIFVFLNSALRTVSQALGDTKTPLYIFGISNIINAVLDPVFMFPLKMGIKGAAVATVFSTIFSFLAMYYLLIKKLYASSICACLRSLRLHFNDSIRLLRIGGWACVQNIARPITGMLMFSLVYKVGGKEATAAFGIGGQLFNYTFILITGLSTAIAIMVGQSLGMGDKKSCDRIISEGLKLSAINMAIFAVPYVIIPEPIIRIFIDDPLVVQNGAAYLRIVYIGVIFTVFTSTYGGVFQGSGNTFPPMVSSLVANVALKLIIAYVLASTLHLGTIGVWIAISASVLIEAAILSVYYKKGKWKETEI